MPCHPATCPTDLSEQDFRAALGMFATGVTIVTARAPDGALVGLTANSFNSVSIHPPLVLWSLSQRSASIPTFRAGSHYAINILSADQQSLAERFAAPVGNRWQGTAWRPGVAGAPLIEGAVAHFECLNKSRYDEGDHVIFVGQVERAGHQPGAAPLLFHGGRFYTEHPL
ncbi:flavin reductase family protein [Ottowia sp.]|uniref:flavin reductase family protein n=1 Tax=Ottowia sp. TaxID=1898956 RepID=UPI003A8A0DA7